MQFDTVRYMRWAKTHQGRARYSFTCSNMRTLTSAELELGPDDLVLDSADVDGYRPLYSAAATAFGASIPQVFAGPGATGCNFVVMAALLGTEAGPGHVLCESPGYTCIDDAARAFGGEVETFPRPWSANFALDFDELRRRIRPHTRLVIVTNLHNPTGVLLERSELEELARLSDRHGFHVLVDEVYKDFVDERRVPHAFRFGERMISVTGFSKVYGLTGLRIGFVFAAPEMVARCHRVFDYLGAKLAVPSAAIAARALGRRDRILQRARAVAEPALALVRKHIEADDLLRWVAPPAGIIAAPRLPAGIDATVLAAFLETRHETAVTPGDYFDLPGHVRLGFGLMPPAELDEALTVFRRGVHEFVRG